MSPYGGLPTEILYQIVSLISAGTLLDLALSSKLLHSLCEAQLTRHRALSEKYRHVLLAWPNVEGKFPGRTLWEQERRHFVGPTIVLLSDIVDDRDVGWHVRSLNLLHSLFSFQYVELSRVSKAMAHQVRTLVLKHDGFEAFFKGLCLRNWFLKPFFSRSPCHLSVCYRLVRWPLS